MGKMLAILLLEKKKPKTHTDGIRGECGRRVTQEGLQAARCRGLSWFESACASPVITHSNPSVRSVAGSGGTAVGSHVQRQFDMGFGSISGGTTLCRERETRAGMGSEPGAGWGGGEECSRQREQHAPKPRGRRAGPLRAQGTQAGYFYRSVRWES